MAAALLLLMGPGAALAQRGGGWADPSAIIAAELAYDRVAAEKGQWTALGQIVAEDAVMFRPGPVLAERWIKAQRNPSVAIRWQTLAVFMACDGSYAISTGRWVRAGQQGRFTNIWRRDKKGYRLALNAESLAAGNPENRAALEADELEAISARVATCPRRERGGESQRAAARQGEEGRGKGQPMPPPREPKAPLPLSRDERSPDGTLRWRWAVAPDGARTVEAWMATDAGQAQIVSERTEPPVL